MAESARIEREAKQASEFSRREALKQTRVAKGAKREAGVAVQRAENEATRLRFMCKELLKEAEQKASESAQVLRTLAANAARAPPQYYSASDALPCEREEDLVAPNWQPKYVLAALCSLVSAFYLLNTICSLLLLCPLIYINLTPFHNIASSSALPRCIASSMAGWHVHRSLSDLLPWHIHIQTHITHIMHPLPTPGN